DIAFKARCVPRDGERKLALYVYEYLLHVGAQKSAQTFLSEIRWEKNITLGEPPGFLHSWWCVFWDLYCAAPDRRETCEHSSEAKAFHDYSAAAAPSPVMGNMPPSDGMPGGPMPPGFFQPFMSPRYPGGPRASLRMPNQPPVGVPGSQPLLPNSLDPTRPQGHPNMGGPMRMNPPRGMGGMGPQVSVPPPSPHPHRTPYGQTAHCVSHDDSRPLSRPLNVPLSLRGTLCHGASPSAGSGDMDGLPKNSPNNMAGMNNPPGTPRDDGEMGGNFLNPFQSESYSPNMTMSV
uniref:Single stranded DNA binding protein 4 n=1 Tax=Scleropages formosus TaxID=113540 RepID=A0A8C9TXM0_SCLFO